MTRVSPFDGQTQDFKTKTMTSAQMAWNLKRGFAWEDPANEDEDCHCLAEVFWTMDGGYMWNVHFQIYECVI